MSHGGYCKGHGSKNALIDFRDLARNRLRLLSTNCISVQAEYLALARHVVMHELLSAIANAGRPILRRRVSSLQTFVDSEEPERMTGQIPSRKRLSRLLPSRPVRCTASSPSLTDFR